VPFRPRRRREEDLPGDLVATLRVHARSDDLLPHVGDGWLPLVRACHAAVVAEFPDYELLAVKQKYAELEFQAFPRPGRSTWTREEDERLEDITERFRAESLDTCEECGRAGEFRWLDGHALILCDECFP
jgi:hypothetical protein